MEPRKLKALLATLSAFGVSSYEHDGLKVHFADRMAPEPTGEVDVTDADTSWAASIPPDPRKAIHEAYQRAEARKRRVRS